VSDNPQPTPVPGLLIRYEIPIDSTGQKITYDIGMDATCDRRDLDELFDRIGAAAARRKAIFDLPIQELSLAGAKAMLPIQIKEREKAVATQELHVLRMSEHRRGKVEPLQSDVNAVVNFDGNIMQLRRRILQEEKQVAYLKAIIAGADPNTLSAVDDDTFGLAAE
jgi:hypothetical protein